jgi:hypothetical protein
MHLLLSVLVALKTPLDPLHNDGYQFWSGIGSDFGEVTLVVGIIAWWHHINCIEKGCWRKGHADPAHGHPVCRRHKRHYEHPAFGD